MKLFVFKLKQIYFIIIFCPLMAFFNTANTNKSTFFGTIFVIESSKVTIKGNIPELTVYPQCNQLERTSLLRQNILKKLLTSPSKQLSALFIGLNESSHQELFNQSFFLKNSKSFKSYHEKTKILKNAPFWKTSFLRHHVITSNRQI